MFYFFLRRSFVLLYLLHLSSYLHAEALALSVNAEAAILMNSDNGAILYEKNAKELHFPASITKIATAAYALHKKGADLGIKITAEQEMIGCVTEEVKRRGNYAMPSYTLVSGGTHIGIKKLEVLTLRDLLHGMMLVSGNDASNVVAHYIGEGSIPQFMQELNAYLKQIGCLSTTFYNPHGLHHPKHQTTAYDMATLAREALKNPLFRQIVSTVRYTRPKTNKQEASTWVQGNRLLRSGEFYYPKAIGIKTGYLSVAGNTFVGAATQGDRTLIAVLLKVKERSDMFKDAVKMFEAAFSQPKVQRVLLKGGEQKFSLQLPQANQPVATHLLEDLTLEYYPAEEPKFKCLLNWDPNLSLPIEKDALVGELIVQAQNGSVIKKASLYSQEKVEANRWQRIKTALFGDGSKPLYVKFLGIAFIVLLLTFLISRLRR